MLQPSYPYYLGNEPVAANRDLEVADKYSGEVVTRVALAGREAIDRAIALAGLGDTVHQPIATLSKGFRQRVGLADALLGDPPLLVLDEPTSGMDPIQTRELRQHLTGAAKERAVLVSSHAVADLEAMATRIAVLRDGKLVCAGTREELCAKAGKKQLDDAVVWHMGDER